MYNFGIEPPNGGARVRGNLIDKTKKGRNHQRDNGGKSLRLEHIQLTYLIIITYRMTHPNRDGHPFTVYTILYVPVL
jgi:hypothetical protein